MTNPLGHPPHPRDPPVGHPVSTVVHTYDGANPGPTLYVQAAQHGREVNEAEVLRRLHDRLLDTDLAGRAVKGDSLANVALRQLGSSRP